MRLVVILGLDPSPEAQIELIDRRDTFQIQTLDQLTTECSPCSFNLSFRWSVTRPAVHEVNREPWTHHPQSIAADAGMIIQQKVPHDAAPGHGMIEDSEKTL